MTRPAERRAAIAHAYAHAIQQVAEQARQGAGACCAPPTLESTRQEAGSCCAPPTPEKADAGTSACSARYGSELADVPHGAAATSFGCGNPLALSQVRAGDTVLDLGSGAGLDLILAARRVGPTGTVIGVDMTPSMIDAARRNLAAAGVTNAEVRQGLIEDLPVDSASVDRVISNCVVNLSPEKRRVFAELGRVLVPGGTFCIADIVAEGLPADLREHPLAWTACIAGAIPEAEYLAGLRAAGLVDVEVVDRLLYAPEQLRGLLASDLAHHGLDEHALDDAVAASAGRVSSVRVVGRRPAAEPADRDLPRHR